ncbi:plasmid recombination protein [Polynucleobacter sp. 31A-FELB]|uniref:plasmid recombination protein n=1 Tax=Polynucleobacter sp. 31A-FELB TaxID=2689096 RepID=UPI001C0B8EBC|nr:plasmid recombination protein [Polynucleobacter sp. 31A-FELB]MBU3587621.1 plasmid recombination protein [Polynucleobacter sp. 31A-FELB]
MFKLDLRGHLLYLNGNSQTLVLAEAHNNRKIPIELYARDKIDPSKTYLNKQIVPLNKSLEVTVQDLIVGAGINTSKGTFKRKDKGYAIEWIFSVTPGFICDFNHLYMRCLDWLMDKFPYCPVAHAVIHYDEDVPHIHIIMVPIEGNHLPASKILGFKGCSRERSYDLYEKVGAEFGLAYSMYLKGAAKKSAAEKAIKELEKLHYREKLGKLWQPFKTAVKSRPEPFLDALGILLNAHVY